jgi:2-methylcitrate dehydratase PrpD
MLSGRPGAPNLSVPRNQRSRSDFPNIGSVLSYFRPPSDLPAAVTVPRPIGHSGVTYTGTYGGFLGPRTVFEGTHGLFHGFAHTTQGDYAALEDFGTRWVIETLAFKPYPCGTMAHPYIDCARRLAARGIKADDIKEMVCEVAEGTVHRLWEPLASKQRPPNGYAAKFSTPFILASGFVRGGVGLDAFTEEAVRDETVLALASKVSYVVDPYNPYPNAFTGHIRAVLKDGRVVEERQPHFRGGANEPLTRDDIAEKFVLNARHGGWDDARAKAALKLLAKLYDGAVDLAPLRG